MRAACAIVGLGVTAQGIGLGIGSRELRTQAVELALSDAGLERDAIDGYIHTYIDREDLRYMGLAPNFSVSMMTGGATPVFGLITAVGAILAGQAEMVACVYGQAQSARESLGVLGGEYTLCRPRLNQCYQGSTKSGKAPAKTSGMLGFSLSMSGSQVKSQFNVELAGEGTLYDGGPHVWMLKLTPKGGATGFQAETWDALV